MKPVSHHHLLVPNTLVGRIFLWWFKKYLNRETYRIRARGRGPRAATAKANGQYARSFDQDLPVAHAKRLALYLDVKDTARERQRLISEQTARRARE